MNELHVWESFRKGNRQALGDLFTYVYKDLYRYGLKITSNTDLLDDSIQDLFLELWQRRENLPEISSVNGYLFMALKFKVLKVINRQPKAEDILEVDQYVFELSPESLLIEHQQTVDTHSKLANAIKQLPQRQQEALYLKYFSQLDYEAISEVMGISKQAVINLNYKSMRFLRDYLVSIIIFVYAYSVIVKAINI